MNIREYRDTHCKDMKPEVLSAGEYLEREGLLFTKDFSLLSAVDIAANRFTDKLDEEESNGKLGIG